MTSLVGDRTYSNISSNNTITAKKIVAVNVSSDSNTVNVMNADQGVFNTMETLVGMINTLETTTGNIESLESKTGTIGTLNSTTGTIGTLNSTTGTIGTLNSTTGTITTGTITNIRMPITSVSQQTSTSTPVTINSSSGTIYTVSSNLGPGQSFAFQVNNNKVTQNSVILLTCFYGGSGTPNVRVDSQSLLGNFSITVTNVDSVAAFNDLVRIHFLVINQPLP